MGLWNDFKNPRPPVGCGGTGPWRVGFHGAYGDIGYVEVKENCLGPEFVITPFDPKLKVKIFEDVDGVVRVRYRR